MFVLVGCNLLQRRNFMYFLPILAASTAYLIFPSLLLALAIALLIHAYFKFAGDGVSAYQRALLRGQLSFRMLTVKLLSLNGGMSDEAYHRHQMDIPDTLENSELRSELRNVAFVNGEDWKHWARTLRRIYRNKPEVILDRYQTIVGQLAATSHGITDDSQGRLVELAKAWGIGPKSARECFAKAQVRPEGAMLAW